MHYHLELADLLARRMRAQGLDVPRFDLDSVPALPDGWAFPLSDNPSHTCEGERLVELPPVLVADVAVTSYENGKPHGLVYRAKDRFTPYWIVGARVIHDFVPYPPEPFRAVNEIEAACIFAQHPRLGSVRSHRGFGQMGHGSKQAYRCPERQRIVLARALHDRYNHHAAFFRWKISLESPAIGSTDPDPLPRDVPAGAETH